MFLPGVSPQFCTAGTYTIQVQYTMTYPDTSPIESAAIANWWRYTSTIAMKNIGTRNLTNWALKVGFNDNEYVTAVDGASSTPLYPAYGAYNLFAVTNLMLIRMRLALYGQTNCRKLAPSYRHDWRSLPGVEDCACNSVQLESFSIEQGASEWGDAW